MAVAFGCYLNNCAEYTGEVPIGYTSLEAWATYACVNAYYINSEGNLTLDYDKKAECLLKEVQEAIDNEPLRRKDLYGSEEVLDSQYVKKTVVGDVVILNDVKPIAPRVKITGIDNSKYNTLTVCTQDINMLPCSAKTETINGVTFTKNYSGAITVTGTPTDKIEYTVAGSETNTEPLFVIKKNHDYYLNLGGFRCELRYFDGETTRQQYVGADGLLNLDESIEVTHVVLYINPHVPVYPSNRSYPSETLYPGGGIEINQTFFPQLEYGNAFTEYKAHKSSALTLNFDSVEGSMDYVLIENGIVYASVYGKLETLCSGNVRLYRDYSMVYATRDVEIDIEYSTNVIDVESLEFLQGKETTTKKFKVLEDGSIEAHNGYFAGKVEADEGYFKGRVEANEGVFHGRVEGEEGYFHGSVTSSDVHITGGDIIIDNKEEYDEAVVVIKSSPPDTDPYTVFITSTSFEVLQGRDYAYFFQHGVRIGHQTAAGDDIRTSIDKESAIFGGNVTIVDDLAVWGEKSRVSNTENYGNRLLYCYETPSPMFGDLGEGLIDETGKCYVFFDDIFAETIDTGCAYQVFLQPYGDGSCYVSERTSTHFVVCGTSNMKFGWEVKAIQKEYDTMRLEEYHPTEEEEEDVLTVTSCYLKSLLYDVESEVF